MPDHPQQAIKNEHIHTCAGFYDMQQSERQVSCA